MTDSIVMYRSFFEAARVLEGDAYKELVDAVARYSFDDEEPGAMSPVPGALFSVIRPQIDAVKRKREAGKLGGRPKKPKVSESENQTKPKVINSENQTKPNDNVNDNVNVNGNRDMSLSQGVFSIYPKAVTNRIIAEQELFQVLKSVPIDDLKQAIKNYAEAVKILETEDRYIKDIHNFLRDNTFMSYMPGTYVKPKAKKVKPGSFGDMPQSEIDFDDLASKVFAN